MVLCLRQLCISELVFRPFPVEVRFLTSFMFLSNFLVHSKCLLIAFADAFYPPSLCFPFWTEQMLLVTHDQIQQNFCSKLGGVPVG